MDEATIKELAEKCATTVYDRGPYDSPTELIAAVLRAALPPDPKPASEGAVRHRYPRRWDIHKATMKYPYWEQVSEKSHIESVYGPDPDAIHGPDIRGKSPDYETAEDCENDADLVELFDHLPTPEAVEAGREEAKHAPIERIRNRENGDIGEVIRRERRLAHNRFAMCVDVKRERDGQLASWFEIDTEPAPAELPETTGEFESAMRSLHQEVEYDFKNGDYLVARVKKNLAPLFARLAAENVRLTKERDFREKQVKYLEDSRPLCPDCRDKCKGEPCLRCKIQRWAKRVEEAEADRDSWKSRAEAAERERDDEKHHTILGRAMFDAVQLCHDADIHGDNKEQHTDKLLTEWQLQQLRVHQLEKDLAAEKVRSEAAERHRSEFRDRLETQTKNLDRFNEEYKSLTARAEGAEKSLAEMRNDRADVQRIVDWIVDPELRRPELAFTSGPERVVVDHVYKNLQHLAAVETENAALQSQLDAARAEVATLKVSIAEKLTDAQQRLDACDSVANRVVGELRLERDAARASEAACREVLRAYDRDGNSPGHSHQVRETWDDSDGEPCQQCLAWNAAINGSAGTALLDELQRLRGEVADLTADRERYRVALVKTTKDWQRLLGELESARGELQWVLGEGGK